MFLKLNLFEIYSSLPVGSTMKNKCYLFPPVDYWIFGTCFIYYRSFDMGTWLFDRSQFITMATGQFRRLQLNIKIVKRISWSRL
jgi:hypothetical protein